MIDKTKYEKQFTPGPWIIESAPNKDGYFSITGGGNFSEIEQGDSYYERRVPVCYFPSVVDREKRTYRNNEKDLSNARLIAAAPDMLEALETVLRLPGFEASEPYGIMVFKAIKKAIGE